MIQFTCLQNLILKKRQKREHISCPCEKVTNQQGNFQDFMRMLEITIMPIAKPSATRKWLAYFLQWCKYLTISHIKEPLQ